MAGKGYQKHVVLGRLGGDPEQRETRSGSTVTNFSLAVNETNSDGEEVTTWYRIAAWNGRGKVCARYLTKGRKVLVEGTRLKASAWIDEDGNARASLELTADNVVFLDGPRDEEDEALEIVQPRGKVRQLRPPADAGLGRASAGRLGGDPLLAATHSTESNYLRVVALFFATPLPKTSIIKGTCKRRTSDAAHNRTTGRDACHLRPAPLANSEYCPSLDP